MNNENLLHNDYHFNQDVFLRSLASSPFSGIERVYLLTPTPEQDRLTTTNIKMIIFGVLTTLMYALLLKHQDALVHFAKLSHDGHHSYFIIPILIALIFSYVHGTFTSNFWESLDVKSKKKKA